MDIPNIPFLDKGAHTFEYCVCVVMLIMPFIIMEENIRKKAINNNA